MKGRKLDIEWATEGQKDLQEALDQAGLGSWTQRLLKELDQVLGLIEAFPGLGRTGSITGAREHLLAELPFLLVYEVFEGKLFVLRLLHTSRQWPPLKTKKGKA